jgi:hypothetical protein
MNEPKIIENVQKLTWNFVEVKKELSEHVKKYANLVVNEDNLTEMEKTQREVASLRTKLNKFRLAVKKDLDKPYDKFKSQVDELLELVGNVEIPIKDQIEKYELQRRKDKKEEIKQFINTTCEELKLFDKFRDQIVIDDRWMNRGQKIKDTQDEVYIKIGWLLDIQNKEIDAKNFRLQKIEMAKFMCESLSKGLATPLMFSEIEHRLESFDIASMRSYIENEIASRKDREEKAAQQAIERAERERLAEVARQDKAEQEVLDRQEKARVEAERLEARRLESVRQMEINAANLVTQKKADDLIKTAAQPAPKPEKLYKAQFVLYDIKLEQIEEVKQYLIHKEIEFEQAVKVAK